MIPKDSGTSCGDNYSLAPVDSFMAYPISLPPDEVKSEINRKYLFPVIGYMRENKIINECFELKPTISLKRKILNSRSGAKGYRAIKRGF